MNDIINKLDGDVPNEISALTETIWRKAIAQVEQKFKLQYQTIVRENGQLKSSKQEIELQNKQFKVDILKVKQLLDESKKENSQIMRQLQEKSSEFGVLDTSFKNFEQTSVIKMKELEQQVVSLSEQLSELRRLSQDKDKRITLLSEKETRHSQEKQRILHKTEGKSQLQIEEKRQYAKRLESDIEQLKRNLDLNDLALKTELNVSQKRAKEFESERNNFKIKLKMNEDEISTIKSLLLDVKADKNQQEKLRQHFEIKSAQLEAELVVLRRNVSQSVL